jgi:hypothetical protein
MNGYREVSRTIFFSWMSYNEVMHNSDIIFRLPSCIHYLFFPFFTFVSSCYCFYIAVMHCKGARA